MAVPTITLIQPTSGHTGGQTLVEIQGTGFQLPADPPATGPVPTPAPSVRVTFGGADALDVAVHSDTLLYVLTPISPTASLDDKGQIDIGPGVVDIVVENIDDTGATITGETVTSAQAFTYLRPDLSKENHATIVLGRFVDELRRQIHPNVDFAVHSDWSDNNGNSLNLAYLPTLPALLITDVEFVESLERPQSSVEEEMDGGMFLLKRPRPALTLALTLMGVSDTVTEIGSLMVCTRLFFQKNGALLVPRNPAESHALSPTSYGPANWPSGSISYALEYTGAEPIRLSTQAGGGNSNIKTFAFQCVIRGIQLEDMPMPDAAEQGTTAMPATKPHEDTIGIGYVGTDVELGHYAKT